MLAAAQSSSNTACRRIPPAFACFLALLLGACQNVAPAQPPTPAPVVFVPIDDLLKAGAAPTQGEVTTAGYLVVDSVGAILVDGLGFMADGTPRLLDSDQDRIWLGADVGTSLKGDLRATSSFNFATARVRGRLEGPGAYGAGGRYRYQMVGPSIELIGAQETTIGDLLDHSATYEGRLVRLVGSLIARDSSALLVEQIGAGGLPEPKARQIKLRAPLQDRALLGRLKSASGGTIHFGQVQIEGFWRDGVLIPLSIVLVT